MAVKTITITKEAYEKLTSNKKEGESFTELINRNFTKRGDISQFIGAWSDMSDETADRIKEHIEIMRRRAGKRKRKELLKHLR